MRLNNSQKIVLPSPLVYIIILNWNGFNNTAKCIKSLLKITYSNYRILVIDNGSENNEAEKLKSEFGNKISVLPLDKNLGFTGGVNFGIKSAEKDNPDFYLLLNNDTEVRSDFLENLISVFKEDSKIGVVSPVIYDLNNKTKIVFSGGHINWLIGKTFHYKNKIDTIRDCEFITGCCLLIKKGVIKKVGELDDRFFAYFEDAAYSVSTTNSGYKCVCDPNSIIYHKEGSSTDSKGTFKTYLISRNRIIFVNNYAPKHFIFIFNMYNFLKLIFAILFFLFTNQIKRSKAYLKGYIDGNLNRGGIPNL